VEPDIKKTITTFIGNYLIKDTVSTLDEDASFLEDGLIDSVGVLELVAFLEETYGFRVEDEEINPANLDSVNKLVAYVQSKLTQITS
jgi:acyl carrier protein